MKQKEAAIKILLKKGAFADIQAMSQYDVRLVFVLAEILVTEADELLYLRAAIALAMVGSEGLPFLVHTTANHTNPAVRLASIQAIAKANDKRTVPTLIDALQDSQAIVRTKAARVLGQLGDARAINALIDLISNDKQHGPREGGIIALGKIGSARALTPLAQIIQSNEDPTLVACARQAIEEIQESSGVQLPKL